MLLGLNNKVALVCAASQGLGRAIAHALHEEGAKVVICSRSESGLKAVRDELFERGGNDDSVLTVVADLGVAADITALFEAVQSRWGAVDVLVNNAGGPPAGSHSEINDEQWQRYFELTVRSAVRLSELVIPGMRANGWGRIINVSSFSIKQPMPNMLLSNSLRLAVLGWAKTLANEVAADGILVNTVCPGWTRTGRVSNLLDSKARSTGEALDSINQGIVSEIPLGRMGEPHEIANAVLFFASEMASFVTGTALAVDGGHAQVF